MGSLIIRVISILTFVINFCRLGYGSFIFE